MRCIFAAAGLGLVVQLVRIHACHAWGREFESRPDRQPKSRVPQLQRLGDFCFPLMPRVVDQGASIKPNWTIMSDSGIHPQSRLGAKTPLSKHQASPPTRHARIDERDCSVARGLGADHTVPIPERRQPPTFSRVLHRPLTASRWLASWPSGGAPFSFSEDGAYPAKTRAKKHSAAWRGEQRMTECVCN